MVDYLNKFKNSFYTLIVIKNDEILYKSREDGIKSVIELYQNNPKLLEDATIIDKVVGRAVAMIYELASIKKCYGFLISEGALDILNEAEIFCKAEKTVKFIRNRKKDDLCPMEKLTLNIKDSSTGYEKIKEFLNKN